MQVWKPLVLIVPAGLLLGMVGGHLARPVMPERAVEPWRSGAEQAEPADYPALAPSPMPYAGGYSYPPDTGAEAWNPGQDRWAYADIPLPTIAELDARQTALLADPEVEFAVSPPDELARADTARARIPPTDLGPEPRTADGKLPAIW
jgi:hypothetical protein